MTLIAQSWVQIGALAVIIAGALFYQAHYLNQRLAAFEKSIDTRFDDLKLWIQSEFRRIDQRIDNLAEKIARLEERVGKLEGRIEHPVLKG